ncbi:MAG: hypothetical protein WCL49_10935 [bacterium]
MAHAALHFAIGLAAGMATQAPRLKQAWTKGKNVAPTVLRWLVVSWSLGVWAIVPSLLRYAGVPEGFCNGWWMNLFLLHPLINQFGPHGTIIGAVAFVIGFTFQYALILAAIARLPKNAG